MYIGLTIEPLTTIDQHPANLLSLLSLVACGALAGLFADQS